MDAPKHSPPITRQGVLALIGCLAVAGVIAAVGYGLLYANLGDWQLLALLVVTGLNALALLVVFVGAVGWVDLPGGLLAGPTVGEVERPDALSISVDVAHLDASLGDPDLLADALTDTLRTRLDLSAVHMYLIGPEEEGAKAILRSAAASGIVPADAAYSLSPGDDSLVGQALERGEPVAGHDLPAPRRKGAEVAIPLIVEGRVLGALSLQAEGRSRFGAHEVKTFCHLADHVALALGAKHRGRLARSAEGPLAAPTSTTGDLSRAEMGQPSAMQAQVVGDVTSGLQGATSVDEVLRTAAQTLRKTLGGYRVRLRLSPGALAERPPGSQADAHPKPGEEGDA
jgi:GAF domain-containing protein